MLVRLSRHIGGRAGHKNSRPVLLDGCQEEMFTGQYAAIIKA